MKCFIVNAICKVNLNTSLSVSKYDDKGFKENVVISGKINFLPIKIKVLRNVQSPVEGDCTITIKFLGDWKSIEEWDDIDYYEKSSIPYALKRRIYKGLQPLKSGFENMFY